MSHINPDFSINTSKAESVETQETLIKHLKDLTNEALTQSNNRGIKLFAHATVLIRQFHLGESGITALDILSECFRRGVCHLKAGKPMPVPAGWVNETIYRVVRERSREQARKQAPPVVNNRNTASQSKNQMELSELLRSAKDDNDYLNGGDGDDMIDSSYEADELEATQECLHELGSGAFSVSVRERKNIVEIAQKYCKLSKLENPSEDEIEKLAAILEFSQYDQELSCLINEADHFIHDELNLSGTPKNRYATNCQMLQNRAIAETILYDLTHRQADVWLLYRAGLTYQQIADELYITLNTVKRHLKDIRLKQKMITNPDKQAECVSV